MDMGGFNGCVVVVVVVGALVVVAEQVMRLEATYTVGDTKDSHRKVQTDVRRTKHVVAIVGGMMLDGRRNDFDDVVDMIYDFYINYIQIVVVLICKREKNCG
jgi:hypothetical protein